LTPPLSLSLFLYSSFSLFLDLSHINRWNIHWCLGSTHRSICVADLWRKTTNILPSHMGLHTYLCTHELALSLVSLLSVQNTLCNDCFYRFTWRYNVGKCYSELRRHTLVRKTGRFLHFRMYSALFIFLAIFPRIFFFLSFSL
jgi:hypothetical protein